MGWSLSMGYIPMGRNPTVLVTDTAPSKMKGFEVSPRKPSPSRVSYGLAFSVVVTPRALDSIGKAAATALLALAMASLSRSANCP